MIVHREDIGNIASNLRMAGNKIVFTNGCFDIIHSGHISYLESAKLLGDILMIGLNTDSSVRRLKGNSRPVNSEQDRAIVLNALSCVDYVIYFDEDTPIDLIKIIKPDVLVKGGDYTFDTIVGASFVADNGGCVRIIPLLENRSTTNIIKKLCKEYK